MSNEEVEGFDGAQINGFGLTSSVLSELYNSCPELNCIKLKYRFPISIKYNRGNSSFVTDQTNQQRYFMLPVSPWSVV